MTTRTDALHDALDRLSSYGYTDGVGFACHGPMGAEALGALGYADAVPDWVQAYTAKHPPIDAPPPSGRIDPHDPASWGPVLGDFGRVTDWAAMFREELWDHPWPTVLRTWVPRLLPGHPGGLTHGLLRVAHVVRALPLDRPPSELHLGELSKGLASWAAWYKVLPGLPRLEGNLTPAAAIPQLPSPAEPWSPIEAGTFCRLGELAGLPVALDNLAPPGPIDGALSDLTAAFCRVVAAGPAGATPGLVHSVTPLAAVRALLPYLSAAPAEDLYPRLWHVAAAITVGFATGTGHGKALADTPEPLHPDELAARAAEHRDTHAIKFTEACLREHALRPDSVYLHAARHVLDTTPRW